MSVWGCEQLSTTEWSRSGTEVLYELAAVSFFTPLSPSFFFFAFLLDQRHFSLSIKNGKLGCDDTIRPHSACGIKLDRANSKAVEKASLYDARGLLPRPFRDGCYVKEVICTETKKPGLRETGGSVAGSSRDGVLQRCDGGIWRFSWS